MRDDLSGDTQTWLNKLHNTQAKDRKNREHQGDGHPEKKLVSKQHRKGN